MKFPTPHEVADRLLRDLNEHDVGLLLAGQSTPKGVRLMPDLPIPSLPTQEKPE